MNQTEVIPPNPKATALIANITQLMDEAEEMLRESTSHHAEAQVELLNERCHDLQIRIANFCNETGKEIAARIHRTDLAIRRHPYRSLSIALGAGVLLGAMLVSRQSPSVGQ